MDSSRFCQSCGAALEPNVRFCGACGQPVVPPAASSPTGPVATPPFGGQPTVPPAPWEVELPRPVGPAAPPPSSGPASPPPAAYGGPPTYGGVPGAPPPGASYTPPKKKSRAGLLLLGGCLVIMVLVGILAVGGLLWFKLQEDGRSSGGASGGSVAVATAAVRGGIAKGQLLYSDDFSDPNSGWDVRQGSDATTRYRNGRYEIVVNEIDWVVWGNPGMSFGDFVLEVDATQVAGTDDNDFGVLLRYVDLDNFYRFEISGDGYYSFDLMQDDEWITLIDWVEAPAIKQGNSTNRITVVCDRDLFTFYVNGQYLDEHRDGTFLEGDIGLLVGTIEEAPVHIAFDDVNVWALP